MKLIIDKSSIASAFLHLEDEEYGEIVIHNKKEVCIPHIDICMERFKASVQATLNYTDTKHSDIISVNDPGGKCECRTRIVSTYKKKDRDEPIERTQLRKKLYKQIDAWLLNVGALIATPEVIPSVEADDLLNTFSIQYGKDSIIWTRDKDMLACLGAVLLQGNKEVAKEYNPTDRFPVKSKHIHVYRTIVTGDAADNIKSCKGFGPKKWEAMIELYGEDVIDTLDDLLKSGVPKEKDSIQRAVDKNKTLKEKDKKVVHRYLKSKKLDEIEDSIKDFGPFQYIVTQIEDLYDSYRLLSLFPVNLWEIKWEVGMVSDTTTLVTSEIFPGIIEDLTGKEFDYSVIDFETDVCPESRAWSQTSGVKVDVLESKICGMGLRINHENYYFSVDHKDTDNISLDQLKLVLDLLKGKPVYAHNSTSFENVVMYQEYGEFLPLMYDTSIMAHYVDENDPVHLKGLSKRYLNYTQTSYDEVLNGRSGMRELTGEEVLSYGTDDVVTCDSLQKLFSTKMELEGTLQVFKDVEISAGYFTSLCFIHGVDFDQQKFNELESKNKTNIEEAWSKLSDRLLDLNWEGGTRAEIKNLNIATFNRLYKAEFGKDLEQISSVKAAIRMLGDTELTRLAKDKNFADINDYYKRYWKPVAEFNVRSPKQMNKLMYEVLGLLKRIRNQPTAKMIKDGKKAGKKREEIKGSPATNEAAIQNALAFKDVIGWKGELLQALLDYKGYLTKQSLFLEKYPKFVHWKSGKIHASLRQSSTTTRRYSCSQPNLQQLPKFKGKEFRNMLRAKKGYSFVALDFTGQELRLAAWDSQDENFLNCYRGKNRSDPHNRTGFGIAVTHGMPVIKHNKRTIIESYKDFALLVKGGSFVAKKYRTLGKKVNFTCQFGAGKVKVAQTLCIEEEEAQKYMNSRAKAFPDLVKRVFVWHDICKENKYATTMLGARRHLQGSNDPKKPNHYRLPDSKKDVGAANRLAYSMRIQGSAAEMTKLVCGKMYEEGVFESGLVIPFVTIHDELVLQIDDSALNRYIPILIKIMCQTYADMEIDLETEPEVGKHFGKLKPWEK